MESVKKFLGYLHPYRARICLALIAMAVGGLMVAAYAFLAKNIVDDVFISPEPAVIPLLIVVILIVSFIAGISFFAEEYLSIYVGHAVIRDLRNDLFGHILKLSPAYFKNVTTPQMLSRVINDVGVLRGVLQNAAITLAKDGITILALLGVMFYRDWFLALISSLVFPLLALIVHFFGKRLKKLSQSWLEQFGNLTDRLIQSLENLKIIQSFQKEEQTRRVFGKENQDLFSRLLKTARTSAFAGPLLDLVRGLGIALILVISAYRISAGKMDFGTLASFGAALGLLYGPIKRMVRLLNSASEGLGALQRIFEVLDTVPDIQDAPGTPALPPFEKSIAFEELSFSYDRSWALEKISLSIAAGEIVALVGPSGAGKSTLMNLLLRFYDPQEGRIQLDGRNIRQYSLSSLRSQISWVSQESMLFNDTVRANIAFGKLNATDAEIRAAAQAAHAADFIEKLPEGYDTHIGEKGLAVSGGERQRIAIARAFLKSAPILVLDEATSAVDGPTELLIQDAIRKLVRNRTTLVIAHRPSTISLATKIVLLESGRIMEVGDHKGLLETNSLYKRLYRSQFLQVAL